MNGTVRRRAVAWFAAVWLVFSARATPSAPPEFFRAVHRLEIRLAPADRERLRRDPREDVPAVVLVDGSAWPGVRLHLKGSTGSFRPVDDRPSLTLRRDAVGPPGTGRLHLNNSLEDPSLLHEAMGAELFRRAGLDAPAVGYARLVLDGRDLGLLVVREGFGGDYYTRHFGGDGSIEEPLPTEDIDGPSTRHGTGPRPDRKGIAEALALPDGEDRWSAVSRVVDAERFADFAAVEVFAGHRDGYTLARNNYRYCPDPRGERVVFLPHGMDQLFDNASIPWRPEAAGKVARSMLGSGAGAALYERRFRALFPVLAETRALDAFVDATDERILAALPAAERADQRDRAAEFKARIHARVADLSRQLAAPEPAAALWTDRRMTVGGWSASDAGTAAAMDIVTNRATGTREFHVVAGPATAASWRAALRLPAGKYRLSGRVRTDRVEPLPFGNAHGACLRVLGTTSRSEAATGTRESMAVSVTFELGAEARMGFACELRSSRGEAWFEVDSLVVERLGSP